MNLNNKRLSGQQRLNTNHSEILLNALINSWTESDTARGIPFAVILFVCGYGDKMFFSVLKPSKWLAGLKEWACRSQVANCVKNSHQLSWNFFFEHTSWGNSLMFWKKWTGKFLFLCLSPYPWFYPETKDHLGYVGCNSHTCICVHHQMSHQMKTAFDYHQPSASENFPFSLSISQVI